MAMSSPGWSACAMLPPHRCCLGSAMQTCLLGRWRMHSTFQVCQLSASDSLYDTESGKHPDIPQEPFYRRTYCWTWKVQATA